ncbi:phosphopantetheine-binding protein [Streptomyces andamanensis]|uniref:Phosphopantetheine-binding protein n=1 Tax=Streptomyces andamanensis TaxID=1565035 RepID=A0ABV8TJD1_9ACTN
MTSEPRTPPQPVPAAAGTDVLAGLTDVLAELLEIEPDRIDPRQPFHVLGFDSILTAEFVAAVNARFGIRLAAAVLYDHPTPAALADRIEADATGPGARADTGEQDGPAAAAVLAELRAHLARILHCDPHEIDAREAFPLLGLDSILGAQFVAAVNSAYGLRERPVTLYDHPDLTAMAEHIAVVRAPAPGAAARAATAPPGPRAALTPDEVNALLDAVRDDMLSVDEAVTLLSSRPV